MFEPTSKSPTRADAPSQNCYIPCGEQQRNETVHHPVNPALPGGSAMTESLPATAVVRASRATFDPSRFAEVDAMNTKTSGQGTRAIWGGSPRWESNRRASSTPASMTSLPCCTSTTRGRYISNCGPSREIQTYKERSGSCNVRRTTSTGASPSFRRSRSADRPRRRLANIRNRRTRGLPQCCVRNHPAMLQRSRVACFASCGMSSLMKSTRVPPSGATVSRGIPTSSYMTSSPPASAGQSELR